MNYEKRKSIINYIVSSFIITTLIWGITITPEQQSKAELIISRIWTSASWTQNTQSDTWTGYNSTWMTTIVSKKPITTNNSWDWEHQETTQRWTKLVLDCDAIVLHNDVATEIAQYMCRRNPDKDMLATFMQESGFNPNARWAAWEYGICQLMPNRTNLVWINDERWNTRQRQADRCVDKWLAVPKKWVIRMAYAVRHKYLYLFN